MILFQGIIGLYCLVGVSAFMSLMFPTIYGIALRGLGEDAKFGAAGLIMAILGGSVMPPLQGAIIKQGTIFSMPAENISFIIPLICFVVDCHLWIQDQDFCPLDHNRNISMKLTEKKPLGKTGLLVPQVVYGTSYLGNLYTALPYEEKLALMKKWFECTEKPVVIDTAGKYGAGLALEVIGKGLADLGD